MGIIDKIENAFKDPVQKIVDLVNNNQNDQLLKSETFQLAAKLYGIKQLKDYVIAKDKNDTTKDDTYKSTRRIIINLIKPKIDQRGVDDVFNWMIGIKEDYTSINGSIAYTPQTTEPFLGIDEDKIDRFKTVLLPSLSQKNLTSMIGTYERASKMYDKYMELAEKHKDIKHAEVKAQKEEMIKSGIFKNETFSTWDNIGWVDMEAYRIIEEAKKRKSGQYHTKRKSVKRKSAKRKSAKRKSSRARR